MASDISSSASFSTSVMKPAADEQIDALWGDNIADNTGFLYGRPVRQSYGSIYFRKINAAVAGIQMVGATTIFDEPFYRPLGHNSFVGTASATTFHDGNNPVTTYDNYGTLKWGLYGDLGTWLGTVAYGGVSTPPLNTAQYVRYDTFATTVDLSSYVSVGSWAQLRYTVMGTTTDPDDAGGYMQWSLNNIKVLTKWS